MSVHGAVYLVQPVEFLKTNTYKIGMSYGVEQRPTAYGENSNIISFHQVDNPQKVEKLLKNVFDLNFKKIDGDFYSGNFRLMKKMFIQEVINYELFNYIEKENPKKSTTQHTESKLSKEKLDDVQQFIAECCELKTNFEESVRVLHPAYVEWVTNNIGNEHHKSICAFGKRLKKLHFEKTRRSSITFYKNIRLKEPPKSAKNSKSSNKIPEDPKRKFEKHPSKITKKRPTCKHCGNSFSDQSGVNKHIKTQVCIKT